MDVRHGGCRQRLRRVRGHINVSSVVSVVHEVQQFKVIYQTHFYIKIVRSGSNVTNSILTFSFALTIQGFFPTAIHK